MHRLNPLVRLSWRRFGGEWLLFEPFSGQTHLMSPVTAAVTMAYEERAPLSAAALLEVLRADYGLDVDSSDLVSMREVVDQLVALGLVVTMTEPCCSAT